MNVHFRMYTFLHPALNTARASNAVKFPRVLWKSRKFLCDKRIFVFFASDKLTIDTKFHAKKNLSVGKFEF